MDDVLIGGIEKRGDCRVDYDPRWPERFQRHAGIVCKLWAAGRSRSSTWIHLCAGARGKTDHRHHCPREDAGDRSGLSPALLEAGYVLRVREPDWHQHRMLRTPELDVHVHVFSTDV